MEIPLRKMKLLKDFRNLKEGFEISFKGVTLLVGEQGCGKSSLLELMRDNSKIELDLSEEAQEKGVETFYFDTEKMNPRILDPISAFSNMDGTNKGIGVGVAVSMRYRSHGETLREFTVNAISKAKDCIVFLDEPESGLSLKNQYKLSQEMRSAVSRNVQVICATHCLVLISDEEEVYDLECKRWVSSKDFVDRSRS